MGSAPAAQKLVTKQQYDAAVAGYRQPNNERIVQKDYQESLQSFKDSMAVLPPPAPDLADETVQRARQAARRKLLMGGLTGPLDLSGASATAKLPGLGGT